MNWRELIRNRWVQVGAAAAAGLGLVVLIRRRAGTGATAASSTSTPAPAATGYAGGPGTLDSTGTDVASWLGSYSGNLQTQLDQYQSQLTSALAGLAKVAPSTPAPPTAGGAYGIRYVTRGTGTNPAWTKNLTTIAAQQQVPVSYLLRLNPGVNPTAALSVGQRIRIA
jgi:LysM domain